MSSVAASSLSDRAMKPRFMRFARLVSVAANPPGVFHNLRGKLHVRRRAVPQVAGARLCQAKAAHESAEAEARAPSSRGS